MLQLEYTAGSPYARAIRILLDELVLDYCGSVPSEAPSKTQLGADTPTMQVPTLRDGRMVLWESSTIAEYLLSRTDSRADETPPLAETMWRPAREWEDKLLLATIQTLGTAVTTLSQLTWTGVTLTENQHLRRCAERALNILAWLESKLPEPGQGFMPGSLSVQDVFLACHVRFVQARPLGLDIDLSSLPGIKALLVQLDARHSFTANPIWWWDPGVVGYSADGDPLYGPEA